MYNRYFKIKTHQLLLTLGIDKVRVVQQMPLEMIMSALGAHGRTIWKRANAIDNAQLIPFHERKSISTERTFGKDTTNISKLRTTITAMAENLAFQLRRGNRLTSCISVRIRYSDFNTYSKQTKIAYTSADHIIIPKVLSSVYQFLSTIVFVTALFR